MHKEQKNTDKLELLIDKVYSIKYDVSLNPFQELDFIIENDSRNINFNVRILEEYDSFFLAEALSDDYIVNSINVTISKSHLITGTINMKLLN